MGWGISGLSIISRVNKNVFNNGEAGPVQLQTTDQLALDGNLLILSSTPNVYYTKNETFFKITANGTQGNGPQWFKVETKNGITYEYGNSSDSRFTDEAGSTVMMWRLNKVYDNYGNYIQYKYLSTDRDSRIDEINYTGNSTTGMAPYNKIKFTYGVRTDESKTYVNGSSIVSKYLVTQIKITTEGSQAFKTFDLTYGFDQVHSFLRDIKETGSDGTSLNTTIFKYGSITTATEFERQVSPNLFEQAIDIFPGDFNGDGYTDLLVAPYAYTQQTPQLKYHTQFKVYRNTGSNNFSLAYTSPALVNQSMVTSLRSVPRFKNATFGASDVNGDSRDDIIVSVTSSNGNDNYLDKIAIYKPTNDLATSYSISEYNYGSRQHRKIHTNGHFILNGDFDADGRADYVTVLASGTDFKAFINLPENNNIQEIATNQAIETSDHLYSIDYNGDGKTDIMSVIGSTCKIYSIIKAGSSYTFQLIYNTSYPQKWHDLFFGDFNGDQKTDVLTKILISGSPLWQVAYSRGDGSFDVQNFSFTTLPANPLGEGTSNHLILADVNADGLTDITYTYKVTATPRFDVYLSRGKNFYY